MAWVTSFLAALYVLAKTWEAIQTGGSKSPWGYSGAASMLSVLILGLACFLFLGSYYHTGVKSGLPLRHLLRVTVA